ncbi:HD-GYP domain-containing protein [Desulfonatronovibrio hydrogenovorans]|uniref:HD-GYP domain-containing protein n=1 Tax=Desulfonatronovibrio hydrogenovorans TaxID=53245 RepID=UPI00068EF569|nr:HD domain-containing phosphohydrolase [Desulfonatronovibrio hydrogenovorans]
MTQKSIDPENLNEEFYQVSSEILASFPKFRLPLNLYQFKEDIAQLIPYYFADTRLNQDMQKEIARLSREGQLFVARSDHKIYAKHISKQLDLVLVDKKLTTGEIVYIFRHALTERIKEFYEQPVKPALEKLNSDILVLTEYLWQDNHRINSLLGLLHEEYSMVNLSYNSGILGLAIFIDAQSGGLKRKTLDQLGLGLFTHVLGLTRVPAFILEKKTNLSRDEQSKLTNYPMAGAGIMRKLDVLEETVLNCHLDHKELMNGSGIPRGLKGTEISLAGKITSTVHAYSELTLLRNSQAIPGEKALEYLIQSSTKYDPKMTRRLNKIILNLLVKQKMKKSTPQANHAPGTA